MGSVVGASTGAAFLCSPRPRGIYKGHDETPTKENTMTYIEAIIAAVPFGLIVLILLALAFAATKLFPAFGELMNPTQPDARTDAQIAYMDRTGH
jgi:hypothetical protein